MSRAADVHPSPPQLAAFSLGHLDEERATTVAQHLAACPTCCSAAANTPADPFLRWLCASRAALPETGVVERRGEDESLPEAFGRYRILRKLGEGGMGTVYLAHDTQLERRVALKVPRLRVLADASVYERFYREARAAAAFDHPNLCPVFDAGCQDGIHYLTMPFIEGRSLAEVLVPGQPWPPAQAAGLVRKLALALKEAHDRGVVHRDLKPANILLNQRQEPVITDFGLARLEAGLESQLTAEGALLGTPAYMSPEQVLGEPSAIGPTTDIYGLGVILYQLLAAQLPYQGSPTAILGRILSEEPAPLSQWRPEIDPALEAVCRKAMARQVADRYANMAEMAAALEEHLQPALPPGSRPRRPWMAAAAAGLTIALGIVLLLTTRNGTVKVELNDPHAQLDIKVEADDKQVVAADQAALERTADVLALIDRLGGTSRRDFSLPTRPLLEANFLHTKVTDDDLRALSGQTQLQVLILGDTRISDSGLAHLEGLTNLQRLDLGTTNITDAGLRHLKGMTGLTRLELYRTTIQDAGVAHLSHLRQLRILGLEGTRVGNAGVAHLTGLTRLEALNLGGTNVDDEGLEHLMGLTNIREFHVHGTRVTPSGKRRLQESWAAAPADGRD